MSIATVLEVAGGAALLAGVALATLGVAGIFRMRGTLAQVQAAGLVPIGAILLVIAAPLLTLDLETAGRAALALLFLLATTPVSAHLVAHAARHERKEEEGRYR